VSRRKRPRDEPESIDLERYGAATTIADTIRSRIGRGEAPVAEAATPTITLAAGEVQALAPLPADVARCESDGLELPPPGARWPLSPAEALAAHNREEPVAPTGTEWEAWNERWRPLGPALVIVTSHRLAWIGAGGRQENLWWPQLAASWTSPTLRQLVVFDGATLWRLRDSGLPPVATLVPWAQRASMAAAESPAVRAALTPTSGAVGA
jgi:hypothetical protein